MSTALFAGVDVVDVDYTLMPAFRPCTVLEKPYTLRLLLVLTGPHVCTGKAKCRVYQTRKQSFPAAEHLSYADIELDLHVHVQSGFVLVQQYRSSKLKCFRFKPILL